MPRPSGSASEPWRATCRRPFTFFPPLQPKEVILTDYFKHTVDNLRHNLGLNKALLEGKNAPKAEAVALDWTKDATWPKDSQGNDRKFDIVLGCDLTYDVMMVPPLLDVVMSLLKSGGTFLYVTGGERSVNRRGGLGAQRVLRARVALAWSWRCLTRPHDAVCASSSHQARRRRVY